MQLFFILRNDAILDTQESKNFSKFFRLSQVKFEIRR